MAEQIKVTYLTKEGYKTQAYVDDETLKGTNKHSDVEVWLAWSDEADTYIQVDDFEWDFDWEGTPTKRVPK